MYPIGIVRSNNIVMNAKIPSEEQVETFFLKSRTVWGGILIMLQALDIHIPFANDEIEQLFVALQAIVGWGLAIWGTLSKDRRPLGFSL